MMRIVIVGGGGFAYLLAEGISTQTDHPVVVLSATEHPEFRENLDNCQFELVDYSHREELEYFLQGADLVISTIRGPEQDSVITAARNARVRRFVPAEFEGSIDRRDNSPPALDQGSSATLQLLRRYAQSASRHGRMEYTVFACGIFYERFAPNGLGAYQMGTRDDHANQGDYLIDVGKATSEMIQVNLQNRDVHICMTSVYDVVQYVVAAIELGPRNWPHEYRMRGERMSLRRLLQTCVEVRGVPFRSRVHVVSEMQGILDYYRENNNHTGWWYGIRMLATAQGRYDFTDLNLNNAVGSAVRPVRFREWLAQQVWE